MTGRAWMPDQLPRRSRFHAGVRTPFLVSSVLAHLVFLFLLQVFWHESVVILPEKHKTVQRISGPADLVFNSASSKAAQAPAQPKHAQRSLPRTRAPQAAGAPGGTASQALRERAKEGAAGIVMSLRFRQIYGFNPSHDYRLPIQMAGEVPSVSADEVPPRFEQYVVVEVTIDVDGSVAEARIVTGLVDSAIQRRLLSAIHEFKYKPATRDGVPIPSQLDIVIHIPT